MEVKLKKDFDAAEMIVAVRRCSEDVIFHSDEGDVLNLKSGLSQFVFAAAAVRRDLMEKSVLEIKNPEDAKILADYIVV